MPGLGVPSGLSACQARTNPPDCSPEAPQWGAPEMSLQPHRLYPLCLICDLPSWLLCPPILQVKKLSLIIGEALTSSYIH